MGSMMPHPAVREPRLNCSPVIMKWATCAHGVHQPEPQVPGLCRPCQLFSAYPQPQARRLSSMDTPAPPRWARLAGTVGWMAPVIGFVPLHIPWLLGFPLLAHEKSFHLWYHGRSNGTEGYADGAMGIPAGAFYLATLMLLAVLGGMLSLGLIREWGLISPRWVPWLRGRRVPPLVPLTPTFLGSALL